MSDIYGYSEEFPMEETLCKNCIFKMSRLIVPIDLETFGLEDNVVNELLSESEDETVQIEQHTCLVNQQDMDFVVVECSHFKEKTDLSLFKNNPFCL
jgi:hypothetical protein